MKTCKKHCFFNAKSLPTPPGEGPRGLKCATVVKLTLKRKQKRNSKE